MYKSFIKNFGKRSLIWVAYVLIFGPFSVGLFVSAKDAGDVASALTTAIGLIMFAALGLFANYIDMRGEELNRDVKEMYEEAYNRTMETFKKAQQVRAEADVILNDAKKARDRAVAVAEKLKAKEQKSGGNKVGRAKSSGKKSS